MDFHAWKRNPVRLPMDFHGVAPYLLRPLNPHAYFHGVETYLLSRNNFGSGLSERLPTYFQVIASATPKMRDSLPALPAQTPCSDAGSVCSSSGTGSTRAGSLASMPMSSEIVPTESVVRSTDELMALARSRCFDFFDNTGRYTHITQRFGTDLSPQELKLICDETMVVDKNTDIPFVDATGAWCIDRDPRNDRFDASTERKRQVSVETNGVLQGLREGAWLRRQDPNRGGSSNADRWWAFHWATLIQGAK